MRSHTFIVATALLAAVSLAQAYSFESFAALPSSAKAMAMPTAKDVPRIRAADAVKGMGQWHNTLMTASTSASQECQQALTTMLQGFAQCTQTFAQIGNFFTAAQDGASEADQQNALESYCSSACRTTALQNIHAVRQVCNPRDLEEMEEHSGRNDNSTDGSGAFIWKALTYAINLPCVRENDNGGAYCLPAFSALIKTITSNNGGTYTNEQLDPAQGGVCKPCAWRFFTALTALSTQATVKEWRPIFLVCLKDAASGTYCVPEVQAVTAMPQNNNEEIAAKYQRLCSTRCFPRWLVAAQVMGLADAANGTAREVARGLLERIDSVCLKNEAGQYCFPKWLDLQSKVDQGSAAHGCVYPTGPGAGNGGQCASNCSSYLQNDVVNDLGCCFNSWLWIRTRYGDKPHSAVSSGSIMRYVKETCGITVPEGCPRSNRKARIILRLRNIAYAWVLANKRRFWDAIRADVAGYVGCPLDDVSSTDGDEEGGATELSAYAGMDHSMIKAAKMAGAPIFAAATNMRTYSVRNDATGETFKLTVAPHFAQKGKAFTAQAGTTIDISVGADTDENVASIQSTADGGMADGTFDLTSTNTALPTEAYVEPGAGAGMETSADGSSGERSVPTLTVLAAVTAITLLATF